jgi:hypothetical protein
MSQEAITEIDMDVFSRRIGPYFSWLESRIESGWEQSDAVQKDVLKEVKYLATTMRARFILGVSKEDFTKEVKRTVELFELAQEAFPSESDEVETKMQHFCKGIAEELGKDFLPAEYQPSIPRPPQPPQPHPFPMPEPEPGPEPDEPEEPDEEKISQKVEIEKPKVEAHKKAKIQKAVKQEAPAVKETKPAAKKTAPPKKSAPINKEAKKKTKPKKKGFFAVRWIKSFIWGED